ncbi:MAG TPA: ATP-binding protein [Myxococcaceae bacterium]|nr:ATP-binding protein [Myxococcaceae bacterium]
MNSQTFIRGFRTGFSIVVALLVAVTTFLLWSELAANEKVDSLVEQALTRGVLMGRIRVGAMNLESAVDDHIQAITDEERDTADAEMERMLEDIKAASAEYMKDLPAGEATIWHQFRDTSQALREQVRKAVNYSNRKEAERARRHLVSEVRPISVKLDRLADTLSDANKEETTLVLRKLEDLRFRTTAVAAVVAVAAVLIALYVGNRLTSLLTRQEATIQMQLRELDRRNQELDSFASRVAHDLVSPLAPLKGYLTLIQRSTSISEPEAREMLAMAQSSASRMAELVEALLLFCRAGTPSERAVAELDTAVSTILLEVDQVATKEGVQLERHLDHRVVVACPAQLLQSIAQNLLSNAVKYSAGKPDAKAVVRVSSERGEALLEVQDNGRGMSAESLRSLFQPFFRAAEIRNLPGHGLGMATTKRLVEAHGGSIAVRSQEGLGTQVTVRFPLAAVPSISKNVDASPPADQVPVLRSA